MEIIIWGAYIAVFFFLARMGAGKDALLSGKVGFGVQSLAYVATYISAVALIGFGGLAHKYGLQMMLIALGNVLLGTLFVYYVLAWPTKQLQMKLGARTPAQLLSLGHNAPFLRKILGFIFAFFLSVYAAAVIKGAAMMLTEIFPLDKEACIWLLAAVVGLAVLWGGMRGVLLTEAMQGAIMLFGIGLLAYEVLSLVGGPVDGVKSLALLPATPEANNGFTSLSSGDSGMFIWSLVVVTSVAVWAQPQMIQRHFALQSKKEVQKAALLASGVLLLIVGGMYFIASLSRLILPEMASSDAVIPALVHQLLPGVGKQIFSLAIISASISTCTALFHIASSSLTEDIFSKKTNKISWFCAIMACVLVSAVTAQIEGKIISLIYTTSWSVIGATAFVPYISLVLFKHAHAKAATASAVAGAVSCIGFYLVVSPRTALIMLEGLPAFVQQWPPFVVGLTVSALVYAGLSLRVGMPKTVKEGF